jgi:hypothetical protein
MTALYIRIGQRAEVEEIVRPYQVFGRAMVLAGEMPEVVEGRDSVCPNDLIIRACPFR